MCHRTSPIARDRVVNDRQPPLEMVQLRHELETYTQPHILYQMKGSWVHRFGSIKWRRNRKHGAVRFSFSATRSRVRFDGEVREDSVRNHLIENQDFGAQGCWDATRLCPPLSYVVASHLLEPIHMIYMSVYRSYSNTLRWGCGGPSRSSTKPNGI